jgi:hypothetical protein
MGHSCSPESYKRPARHDANSASREWLLSHLTSCLLFLLLHANNKPPQEFISARIKELPYNVTRKDVTIAAKRMSANQIWDIQPHCTYIWNCYGGYVSMHRYGQIYTAVTNLLVLYVLLPQLSFFRAFSSVVRQMPGYNSQRRGTARTSQIS